MSDAEADRPLDERLADYLAGELTEPERSRFEALLRQDVRLREEADSLAALAAQLTRLPGEAWSLAASAGAPEPESGAVLGSEAAPGSEAEPGSDAESASAAKLAPSGRRRPRGVALPRPGARVRLAGSLAALSLTAFGAGVGAGVLIERPAVVRGRVVALRGRVVALRALLPAFARARVLTGLDGGGRLVLAYRSMPSPGPGRYYEAWLMTSQTQLVALVSFRPSPGGSGQLVTELPAPAGAYRYVDISLQRVGAGAQHSAVSVLRGPTAPLVGRS